MGHKRTKISRGPSQRQLRVGELLREVLTDTFINAPIRDPLLTNVNITITQVLASRDLKQAKVFVIPFDQINIDSSQIIEALDRATPFLRGQVAKRANLRYAPLLKFELDRSMENASRIDALLEKTSIKNG